MKMKSTNDKRIYGVYNGKAYLLDGEPRDYPEAVKRAYADILIDASPAPKAKAKAKDAIPETITTDNPNGGLDG
jgi:hypothetical protein